MSSFYEAFHGEEEDEESLIGRNEDAAEMEGNRSNRHYRLLDENHPAAEVGASAENRSPSPSRVFLKMPVEDRTKYEKLKSKKGQFASDDSDTEFIRSVAGNSDASVAWSTSKRLKFKQMNIPEKIQAQIPAIISKKFQKTKLKRDDQEVPRRPAPEGEGADEDDNDVDSIGSASDLRADEEGGAEGDHVGRNAKANLMTNSRTNRTNVNDTDGISESIRTCGSSAYNAECESVTTNEDSVSRLNVTRKMRLKKRNELNALAEANRHTEDDDEEEEDGADVDIGVHHADKPLLLDDELDYGLDTEDQRNLQTTSDEMQQEESVVAEGADDDFDVFGKAPFKMPDIPKRIHVKQRVASRSSISSNVSEKIRLETPQTEIDFAFQECSSLTTSTPMKSNTFEFGPEATQQCSLNPFLLQGGKSPAVVVAVPSIASPPTEISKEISSENQSPISIRGPTTIATNRHDLFGSEPFRNIPWTPTVAATINKVPALVNPSASVPVKRLDIRPPVATLYSPVSSSILPIADHEFVNFAANEPILSTGIGEHDEVAVDLVDDDTEEFVEGGELDGSGKSDSKKKAKSKKFKINGGSLVTTKLKISKKSTQPHPTTTQRADSLPAGKQVKEESGSFNYHSLKRDVKAGFNNMSFEDFPSDDQDRFEQTVGKKFSKAGTTKLNKIVPFEVLRSDKGSSSEKTEKKFVSLKRRSNPFS